MSENVPFELQVKIISNLPVKSLIQFRSVSKTWKSLIDSPDFITRYSGKMQQHLLVKYRNYVRYAHKYVLIVDDDTFPHHKVSPTLPLLVSELGCCDIIGSSHGLLCLSSYSNRIFYKSIMVVLWNNSIRKAVAVVMPNLGDGEIYKTTLGFGVSSLTADPKIVKIRYIERCSDIESISCIPWQVEVFTLSKQAWRSPHGNLHKKSIQFDHMKRAEEVDGVIYWLAYDNVTMDDGGFRSFNLIISFDITTEEFKEVNLPYTLAHERSLKNLCISKIRKSLVVLECEGDWDHRAFIVWMMDDGNSNSFAKQFTIYTPEATIMDVLGFRNSGEPILEIMNHDIGPDYDSSLVVFEPFLKQINSLDLDGHDRSISACSYNETLLLLDQPDSIVYDKGKNYILNQTPEAGRRAWNSLF